jgi:hypothetical protein
MYADHRGPGGSPPLTDRYDTVPQQALDDLAAQQALVEEFRLWVAAEEERRKSREEYIGGVIVFAFILVPAMLFLLGTCSLWAPR